MPSATARVASTALAVPPTQNTAPVIEFNCLYTHDIRRKSKRWQDGFLRLHTFNQRAMVYDDQRNLVGDTHLTDGKELEDGDEIRLDKGGVLVQVADRRGETTTDLTGVCKQRATANPASSSPLRLPEVNFTPRADRQPLQEKHRSLNALLGANRKPIGKAVPLNKSPFELRQEQDAEGWADHGSVKRRRLSKDDREPTRKAGSMQAQAQERQRKAEAVKAKQPVQVDLTSEDDRAEMLSSIIPTQPTQMPVVRRRSSGPAEQRREMSTSHATKTVKRPEQEEHNSKRLSIAKTTTKRNTLACQGPGQSQTLEQKQRQRLDERIARMGRRAEEAASTRREQAAKLLQSTNKDAMPMPPPGKVQPATKRTSAAPEPEVLHSSFDDMVMDDVDLDAVLQADTVERAASGRQVPDTDFAGLDIPEDEELEELLQAAQVPAKPDQNNNSDETLPELTEDKLEVLTTSSTMAAEDLQHILDVTAAPDDPEPNVETMTNVCDTLEVKDGPQMLVQAQLDDIQPAVKPSPGFTPIKAPHSSPAISTALVDEPEPAIMVADNTDIPVPLKKPPPRKGKRVGRLEIRKSAASCFKPPTLSTRVSSGVSEVPAAGYQPLTVSTIEKGPWSREAFDLFVWRPPGWDEANWCVQGL